jgi:hypothetical protein
LLIRPAAVSSESEPDPAWSPMCRVTFFRLAVLTEPEVPEDADPLADALPEEPDEQAAASAPAASRLRVRGTSGRLARDVRRADMEVMRFLPS